MLSDATIVPADDRFGIQSVEVAASILAAMTAAAGPQALKDISGATRMPAGKVHRYLVSLARTGLAVQEADGRYAIGPAAITLGLAGLHALSPVKLAPEFLRMLRDETGETSALMVWSERGPVVVDIEECPRPIFMNIRPGSLLPIATSASGQAFAAHLPADTLVNIDGRVVKLANAVGRNLNRIKADVQQKGVACIQGLLVPGIAAMAAPVFDHRNRIVATLAFLAREDDVSGSAQKRFAAILTGTARKFSDRLGSRQPHTSWPGR